jgi:hypothetical protein
MKMEVGGCVEGSARLRVSGSRRQFARDTATPKLWAPHQECIAIHSAIVRQHASLGDQGGREVSGMLVKFLLIASRELC